MFRRHEGSRDTYGTKTDYDTETRRHRGCVRTVSHKQGHELRWLSPPRSADQTGLPGLYDRSFRILNGSVSLMRPELERQLGVKLTKTSLQLPALIIESARKPQQD